MANKNVLSIDLDYILAPCISLYNDLVNASTPPEKIWDTIAKVREADKHLSYDDANLHFVFNVFTNALTKLKDKSKVTFALNHDAILLDLATEEYVNDTFTLYNIDHHHDIFYSEQSRIDVDRYSVANVSNWIWYLDKNQKIKQYNWICNKNSTFPPKDLTTHGKMDAHLAENISEELLNVSEWDYIFICNSPHWFPRKYDVFFDMLMTIYKNLTGNEVKIEENVFSPNGRSREYPIKK